MVDEEIKNPAQSDDTMSASDYVKMINDLKANMVKKEDYEKVVSENKVLAEAVLNNQPSEDQEKQIETSEERAKKIEILRNELFSSDDINLSNREFVEKALDLRKELIENGEQDPFLPNGMDVDPADVQKAENVAKTLQEILDASEGNDAIFNGLFEASLVDTGPVKGKGRR